MVVKEIIDEDFVHYKKPSMVIAFPYCDFKCGKENCHNYSFVQAPYFRISSKEIVKRYLNNEITSAIVCAGLEPFWDYFELMELINEFRKYTNDDIVIYTGYTEDEIRLIANSDIGFLNILGNLIIKYGRYNLGDEPHYDDLLGVYLASDNQYAVKIC